MSDGIHYWCPTVGELAAATLVILPSMPIPMHSSTAAESSTDEYRYYVDQIDYTCPMGVESDVRFVIDVQRGDIVIAQIRPHGCTAWQGVDCEEDEYMETNLLGDLLYDVADYASEDGDTIPGDVDPANFSECLPDWA
jgi:hypothetical protein